MEKHRERTVKIVTYSRLSQSTESFIRENLETSAALDICGALDGLTDDDLKMMIADPIGTGVPVEMEDGSWLYVSHGQIDQQAKKVIDKLKASGAETVMMCCTIPWRSLEGLVGVICPSLVMESMAMSLLPEGGTIGVVQPDGITKDEEIKHWKALGVPVLAITISPGENSLAELGDATEMLAAQGADLIVLDCLAFGRDHWRHVRDLTGKPVILPISLLGKVLDEAYG